MLCKEDNLQALINRSDVVLSASHAALLSEGSAALTGHSLLARKLAAIYAEEAAKPNNVKQSINQTSFLLSKLVERENLSCLIVNLHRGNEGYNIALKLANGVETETFNLPYEDDELLTYLDHEQLPPMLVDLLDDANVSEMFISGCLVAEIRDYRRFCYDPVTMTSTGTPCSDTRHVLLRPTMQSIVADVTRLTLDKDWTRSERQKLESELVLATAPPLCLEPTITNTLMRRRLHTRSHVFNTKALRRAVKRCSQPSQARLKILEAGPPPKCMRLLNYFHERKEKRTLSRSITRAQFPTYGDKMEQVTNDLFGAQNFASNSAEKEQNSLLNNATGGEHGGTATAGSQPQLLSFIRGVSDEVHKLSKHPERLTEHPDNSLRFIESHTLETERALGKINLTKLTIYQRPCDQVYCGELYVDRDYQEGKANGSTCTFTYPSLQSVRRYIAQFKEIFSEEGRKRVKITQEVAGQQPRTVYTTGCREPRQVSVQHLPQQQPSVQVISQQQQPLGSVSSAASAAGVSVSVSQFNPQNVLIVASGERPAGAVAAVSGQKLTLSSSGAVAAAASGPVASIPTASAGGSTVGLVGGRTQARLPHVLQRTTISNVASAGGTVVAPSTKLHHTASQLPSVALNQQMQQHAAQQQQVLLSRNVHVLPGSRVAVTSTVQQQQPLLAHAASQQPGASLKMISSSTGANLNSIGQGTKSIMTDADGKALTVLSSSIGAVPGLQALLAGTPSAENPAPNSRNTALIERLSQQLCNPGKSDKSSTCTSGTVKIDAAASALPTITTIITTPTTGREFHTSLSCSSGGGGAAGLTSNNSSATSSSTILRTDTVAAPPNINLANINLPSLNMGLQSLTSGLPGLQSVQVSIPGLAVPISLSVNPNNPAGGTLGVAQQQQQVGSSAGSQSVAAASSGAQTVVLATATSLPQGHVLHLPLVQGSQLATQLSKSAGGQSAPSISVLQQSLSSGGSSSSGSSPLLVTSSSGSNELLTSSTALLPRQQQTVLPRSGPKQQQLHIALQKQGQQLQPKLIQLAAKKSSSQQSLLQPQIYQPPS